MEPELFPLSPNIVHDYQQLYMQVYRQLAKDFYPYIHIVPAPETLTAGWLYSEVKRMLSELIEKQPSSLGPVIYRVDLTEKMVMKTPYGDRRLDELSVLVLKREAQKIWIRTNMR